MTYTVRRSAAVGLGFGSWSLLGSAFWELASGGLPFTIQYLMILDMVIVAIKSPGCWKRNGAYLLCAIVILIFTNEIHMFQWSNAVHKLEARYRSWLVSRKSPAVVICHIYRANLVSSVTTVILMYPILHLEIEELILDLLAEDDEDLSALKTCSLRSEEHTSELQSPC